MALGSASPNDNINNTITNNDIFDFFNATVAYLASVSEQQRQWTISNNRIYQTAPRIFTGTVLRYAGMTIKFQRQRLYDHRKRDRLRRGEWHGTTTISGSTNTL